MPQRGEREKIYAVVGPSGDPLYTFADQRNAFDEAEALNTADARDLDYPESSSP